MANVTMKNVIMENVNETEPHTGAHWWKVGTTQVGASTI